MRAVSLRNWASESDKVRRADYCVESLPMASLSWRHHPLVRAVVLEVPDLVCPHEMALERGLFIHPSCIWRWVQIYGPELDKRCRVHLKSTNKSYRVDETYIRIKGQDHFLYRAVDSTGQTIDFLLTAKRDTAAAKRFFQKTLLDPANPQPRVINVQEPSVSACCGGTQSGRHDAPTLSITSMQVLK